MSSIFWTIFGWICKGLCILTIISGVCFFVSFMRNMITNGGRKWYYYDPVRPWKGGYWTPLLPDHPPYNEYEWNPRTCRFEHKDTGQPLFPWEKPLRSGNKPEMNSQWDWDALGLPDSQPMKLPVVPKKKRPEWIRFLFDETPATLWKKHKIRKWAEKREKENGSRG